MKQSLIHQDLQERERQTSRTAIDQSVCIIGVALTGASTGADVPFEYDGPGNYGTAISTADLPTVAVANGGTGVTALPGGSGDLLYNNGGTVGAKTVTIKHPIGCGVGDPAGSALATGVMCYVSVPYACTISAWTILVDSGTATIGIWKIATGAAIPTVSNSIVASAAPAIATGTAIKSTTLTGWTTAVAADDIFGINLTTTSGPKYLYAAVTCDEVK